MKSQKHELQLWLWGSEKHCHHLQVWHWRMSWSDLLRRTHCLLSNDLNIPPKAKMHVYHNAFKQWLALESVAAQAGQRWMGWGQGHLRGLQLLRQAPDEPLLLAVLLKHRSRAGGRWLWVLRAAGLVPISSSSSSSTASDACRCCSRLWKYSSSSISLARVRRSCWGEASLWGAGLHLCPKISNAEARGT